MVTTGLYVKRYNKTRGYMVTIKTTNFLICIHPHTTNKLHVCMYVHVCTHLLLLLLGHRHFLRFAREARNLLVWVSYQSNVVPITRPGMDDCLNVSVLLPLLRPTANCCNPLDSMLPKNTRPSSGHSRIGIRSSASFRAPMSSSRLNIVLPIVCCWFAK